MTDDLPFLDDDLAALDVQSDTAARMQRTRNELRARNLEFVDQFRVDDFTVTTQEAVELAAGMVPMRIRVLMAQMLDFDDMLRRNAERQEKAL